MADLLAILRPDLGHVGDVALGVELEVVRLEPQLVDATLQVANPVATKIYEYTKKSSKFYFLRSIMSTVVP